MRFAGFAGLHLRWMNFSTTHIYASARAPRVVDRATYSMFAVVVGADGISYFSSLGQGYRGSGTLQLAVAVKARHGTGVNFGDRLHLTRQTRRS